MRVTPLVVILLAAAAPLPIVSSDATVRAGTPPLTDPPAYYRPKLATPELVAPFLKHLAPGGDSFPEEREAAELAHRLVELGDRLKANPDRAASVAEWLLTPGFRGARLLPAEETTGARPGPLEVQRAEALPQDLVLDARAFGAELRRLVRDLRDVTLAEFLITEIAAERDKGLARTEVRYDIVGKGKDAWRAQHVGVWRMKWRCDAASWRVIEWTAAER